jgi:excinuclease Cho
MAGVTPPEFTLDGTPVAALPPCPGIYRFLNQDGHPLYVGKSINIRTRVSSHLAAAARSGRQHQMVHGAAVIDCRPTAGEAGALLLENAAIKEQMPLFNRRQRAVRRLWSIVLEHDSNGFAKPIPTAFSLDVPDVRAAYGSFSSRYHARRTLETLARAGQLCPRILGLQSGGGRCFAHQLGQCRGACVGQEPAPAHNARLIAALRQHRLSAWPLTEPVFLLEDSTGDSAVQPRQEWHLLHNWTYLGTFSDPQSARQSDASQRLMFDRDTYHILRNILQRGGTRLYCAASLQATNWQWQSHSPISFFKEQPV